MLREHQRQRRMSPMLEVRLQMGFDLVCREETLGLQINQLLFEDTQAPKVAFGQQQLEAPATGVEGQHAPDRRANSAELEDGSRPAHQSTKAIIAESKANWWRRARLHRRGTRRNL